MNIKFPIPSVMLLIYFAFIVGCSRPDIKPIGECTVIVASSFRVAGDSSVDSFVFAGYEQEADVLRQALAVRYELLGQLVVFSNNLSAIQSDSDYSKASVDLISSAAGNLATTLSSGISAPITEVATLLANEAIEIREFYLISEALEQIQPYISSITRLLKEDIADLHTIYEDNFNTAFSHLQGMEDVELDAENELTPIIRRLEEYAKSAQVKLSAPQGGEFEEEKKAREVEDERLAAMNRERMDAINQLSALYPIYQDHIAAKNYLVQKKHTLRAERTKILVVYNLAAEAVDAWQKSYDSIIKAFDEGSKPDFSSLYLKAIELKAIVEKI